jgi:hypothetical protein
VDLSGLFKMAVVVVVVVVEVYWICVFLCLNHPDVIDALFRLIQQDQDELFNEDGCITDKSARWNYSKRNDAGDNNRISCRHVT